MPVSQADDLLVVPYLSRYAAANGGVTILRTVGYAPPGVRHGTSARERPQKSSEEFGTGLSRRGDDGAYADQGPGCDPSRDRGLGEFVTEPGGSGDDDRYE